MIKHLTFDQEPGPPGNNEWPIVLASLHLFNLIHSFEGSINANHSNSGSTNGGYKK